MKLVTTCEKIFDSSTVRDTLSTELDSLRKHGYSIFGINEIEVIPNSKGKRVIEIFFE